MGNGKRKFIHNNGDVYKGNWVNNKAEGYNVYNNSDDLKNMVEELKHEVTVLYTMTSMKMKINMEYDIFVGQMILNTKENSIGRISIIKVFILELMEESV